MASMSSSRQASLHSGGNQQSRCTLLFLGKWSSIHFNPEWISLDSDRYFARTIPLSSRPGKVFTVLLSVYPKTGELYHLSPQNSNTAQESACRDRTSIGALVKMARHTYTTMHPCMACGARLERNCTRTAMLHDEFKTRSVFCLEHVSMAPGVPQPRYPEQHPRRVSLYTRQLVADLVSTTGRLFHLCAPHIILHLQSYTFKTRLNNQRTDMTLLAASVL